MAIIFPYGLANCEGELTAEAGAESTSSEIEYVDVDNDGEITQVDTRQQWKYKNYLVKSPYEMEFDSDSDGWLEPDESRRALRQKYDDIISGRGTGVDMDLVREYDANGDGAIDAREAEEIREDTEN